MSLPSSSNSQMRAIEPGRLIGRYRLEHILGSGGMADVYYAIHEDLHRPAAIKILKESLAADDVNLQRFLNEARSAASLIHPNIVQVYDVGRDDNLQYIAQEFIPGANLRQYLAAEEAETLPLAQAAPPPNNSSDALADDRQLDLSEVLSILLQILAALEKSSAAGVVHRDIKPENIMLTKDGEVKVADFGLARTLLGDDPKLTRAGTTMGTPMYMSPEQIQGDPVDVRSDLYSLGVTLFHMIAGRPPFTGETQLALAMMHTQGTVPDITLMRPEIPLSLKELIERLLQKSPADRFANPREVLNFLMKHRQDDLAPIWPEQTLPLPRASEVGHQPSLQATIELQALLRQKKSQSSSGKWLSTVVSVFVILTCFTVGFAMSWSTPLQPPENELFRGVLKMKDAEAQYDFALVNDRLRASRADKWRAVEHYFPKSAPDTINRYYAGMASIQLARALQRKGDTGGALRALDETIQDSRMDDFVKAHAYIVKAIILEEDGGNQADLQAIQDAVDGANRIYLNEDGQQSDLKEQLDAIVNSSQAETTRQAWFGSQN